MSYQRKTKDPFYVNCSLKEFKNILNKTQRTKLKKVIVDYDENMEPIYGKSFENVYTRQATFLLEFDLDRDNWKRNIKANKVKDSEAKLKALIEKFDLNQDILTDNMMTFGKADIIWKTTHASEYANELNDAEAKAQINISLINSKTGKLEIK